MVNKLITCAQVFGIGFGFGVIGPCFLTCAPVLLTYVAGTQRNWRSALADVVIFLSGRLSAYCLLGIFAGISGALIRQIGAPFVNAVVNIIGGALSIMLGVAVLFNKPGGAGVCAVSHNKTFNFGGLFFLGFFIGISPCAPLIALLFEITLISKSAVDGLLYALFFGLGTFLSGLLVVGSAAGLFAWLPERFVRSDRSRSVFRIVCAALLFLLGAAIIMHGRASRV